MSRIFKFLVAAATAAACLSCSTPRANVAETPNTAVEAPGVNFTDPNAAVAEGDRLFEENQTQSAIEAYRQAVKLDPDFADAHFKLGIAYSLYEMQMEQAGAVSEAPANSKEKTPKRNSEIAFERAVGSYEKWIDANPKDDAAFFNLGRAHAKLAKDEEAEKAFKQAVKLKPEDSEYQTELGAILIKLAQYHQAIEPLKKAVELDPGNVRAQDLLDDAKAGRQRIDYVSPKNTNQNTANKTVPSNANANSNTNSDPPRSNSNTRPKRPNTNEKPPPAPPTGRNKAPLCYKSPTSNIVQKQIFLSQKSLTLAR